MFFLISVIFLCKQPRAEQCGNEYYAEDQKKIDLLNTDFDKLLGDNKELFELAYRAEKEFFLIHSHLGDGFRFSENNPSAIALLRETHAVFHRNVKSALELKRKYNVLQNRRGEKKPNYSERERKIKHLMNHRIKAVHLYQKLLTDGGAGVPRCAGGEKTDSFFQSQELLDLHFRILFLNYLSRAYLHSFFESGAYGVEKNRVYRDLFSGFSETGHCLDCLMRIKAYDENFFLKSADYFLKSGYFFLFELGYFGAEGEPEKNRLPADSSSAASPFLSLLLKLKHLTLLGENIASQNEASRQREKNLSLQTSRLDEKMRKQEKQIAELKALLEQSNEKTAALSQESVDALLEKMASGGGLNLRGKAENEESPENLYSILFYSYRGLEWKGTYIDGDEEESSFEIKNFAGLEVNYMRDSGGRFLPAVKLNYTVPFQTSPDHPSIHIAGLGLGLLYEALPQIHALFFIGHSVLNERHSDFSELGLRYRSPFELPLFFRFTLLSIGGVDLATGKRLESRFERLHSFNLALEYEFG